MTDSMLNRVLLKPIVANGRTRRYQETLDAWVDELKSHGDLERGALGTHDTPAPLKGREGTAPLCVAAFCWHSPLSRYHGNPSLLAFFSAGLRYYSESIQDDGLMAAHGLNGADWAHGWDVEGLIYGLIFCQKALPRDLLNGAMARFRLSACRQASLPQARNAIGSYGNQRCVWTLGLHLYGQLLDQPELVALSDHFWEDAKAKVLDDSGQVIEQVGPCMHYSYTAFFYAWLNLVIRGDDSELDRVERCLEWFRWRHTESLYPIAGPSTRQYYEAMAPVAIDLLPAAEQVAPRNPRPLDFATRATGKAPAPRVCGHGASPLMWAILMARDERFAPPDAIPGPETVTLDCKGSTLLKRSPVSYLLVRRQYQTHFNYTDFLPFSGVQTWALAGEPPIIHPTPLAPSTTRGHGLDTARQGVSHNWGLYGAGAVGVDAYSFESAGPGRLRHLVARYDWLWRIVIFTEASTVILEFGNNGPRRTLWTLNRIEPSPPVIDRNIVSFEGRRACLHVSPDLRPRLSSLADLDPWAAGVQQLEYDCGEGPVAFAFSDASFTFDAPPPADAAPWHFSDGSGRYEVMLDPRFFLPNPGNLRVDPFKLAIGTTTKRL